MLYEIKDDNTNIEPLNTHDAIEQIIYLLSKQLNYWDFESCTPDLELDKHI